MIGSFRRFGNSRNVEVSAGGVEWRSRITITTHDSETLCLYPLNFVNVSQKRDVGVVVDIRLARPAQTLPGFPLVIGRKPDSEIDHEVLGADICNGQKLKKIRMSRFFPLFVIKRFEPSFCIETLNLER